MVAIVAGPWDGTSQEKGRDFLCPQYWSIEVGRQEFLPWLVWLSGLSTSLQTERPLVQCPVRAHASVVSQVPSWGCARGNQSMFLSHIDVSLPFFLPPFPLSRNKEIKIFFKKARIPLDPVTSIMAKP